jgi:uncharacterized cupin superfamily protein
MKRVSLHEPPLAFDDEDPPGFRAGMFRPGPELGARRTGATLYVVPAGEALCPYHYECGEEEWLLVLEGVATVRHPEGAAELRPLELAFFPPGPEGAHQVRNDAGAELRVLMWSEVVVPAATVYPDSDKVGIWTGREDDDGLFRRSSAVGYYDGEAR